MSPSVQIPCFLLWSEILHRSSQRSPSAKPQQKIQASFEIALPLFPEPPNPPRTRTTTSIQEKARLFWVTTSTLGSPKNSETDPERGKLPPRRTFLQNRSR